MELYLHSPMRLHGVMYNQLCIGTIFTYIFTLFIAQDRIKSNNFSSFVRMKD
jgi:hypothetical protein